VTAGLSSTDDDVMQWADVFDRDVEDIFAHNSAYCFSGRQE
jgi:TolB-like protein